MSDAAELSPGRTLWEALGDIPDRRGAKGRRSPLRSVLTLSLAAMLAGGNDLCSIFRWGRRLPPEALYLLGLKRAPCHAMYHYFYKALDVAATEQAFSGPAEQARDRGGRQAPGRVRQGARDHVRDEYVPRPAPQVRADQVTTGASSSDRRDLWFLNTRVLIRVSYQDGRDDISVLEHWAGFRDGPPLHVHQSEDEVFQVLAGEVRFRVGDREQRARAGDILLVPQGTPHTYRVESPEGGTLPDHHVRARVRAFCPGLWPPSRAGRVIPSP